MIRKDSSTFQPPPSGAEGDESRLDLRHTFVAKPPVGQMQSLASQGEPPFGQPANVAPRVVAPVAAVRPGPQPVYHLKVTATPIQKVSEEPLRYEVTAGPTEISDKDTSYIGADGRVIVHARHQVPPSRKQQITVKPTNADVLGEGVVGADGARHTVGAQTHVYSGTKGLDPRLVLNKLQMPVNASDPRKPIDISQLTSEHRRDAQRSIPAHRVSVENYLRVHDGGTRGSRRWWPFRQSSDQKPQMQHHSHHDDEEYARALATEIDLGLADNVASGESVHVDVPADTVPLERGYSRMIPSLLQASDDDRQRMYNWIVPQETSLDAREKVAHLESGSTEPVMDETNPLYFQGSAQLANFLEAPGTGMVWEAESMEMIDGANARERAMLKPSIVYGGVEHCPPEFAGRLSPISFRLHALELHQYVAVSGTDAPWFMQNGLNPHTQALFGPVPLPFDPANSGMPAPVFDTMTEAGQPVPKIAPLIRTFFNPELPVQYERKPDTIVKAPGAKPTSESDEDESSEEEEASREASSQGGSSSSPKSGSSGSLEGERLKIPSVSDEAPPQQPAPQKSRSKDRTGSPPPHPQMQSGKSQGVSPPTHSPPETSGSLPRAVGSPPRPSGASPPRATGAAGSPPRGGGSPQIPLPTTDGASPNNP
eukprot:Gregarina_sp_Poly_1__1221@NODE_129_length_13257_cov_57_196588_g115_i0_p2_GENE_NODE_129_length_13257_cov_57_196588_g115_i0NODE_129_length_13257_cov_57_196588_g115_i0_p2_ORF_typecomplete_len654_score100_96DUF2890/PF11081_8/1_5e04DUF2890/PF11081_8/4_NODE_129_length_13257_cov_57_196588_g115_i074589419